MDYSRPRIARNPSDTDIVAGAALAWVDGHILWQIDGMETRAMLGMEETDAGDRHVVTSMTKAPTCVFSMKASCAAASSASG